MLNGFERALGTAVFGYKVEGEPTLVGYAFAAGEFHVPRRTHVGNVRLYIRVFAEDGFNGTHEFVRCFQAGSGRSTHVNIGFVGLYLREKLYTVSQETIDQNNQNQGAARCKHGGPRTIQGPFQAVAIAFEYIVEIRRCFCLAAFDIHKGCTECGVDEKPNQEGGGQRDDEGDGKVFHEFAHNARPKDHGGKRTQGGEGRGDDRYCYFVGACAGACVFVFAFLAVAVNVFDDDDGVVHQHPQGQDEAKEDDHIQGDVEGCQDEEGDEHGKRNGNAHKKGVAYTHKEKEDPNHQQEAGNDIVFQVLDHHANVVGLVGQNMYIGSRREECIALFYQRFDPVRDCDEVFTTAFDDGKAHAGAAVEARVRGTVFESITDFGYITDVNGLVVLGLDQKVSNFGHRFEFTGDAHRIFVLTNIQATARQGHVFVPDRIDDIFERQVVGRQAFGVYIHFHFSFQPAGQTDFQDAGNGFDFVGQVFGHFFEPDEAVIAREVDDHHGDIGEVDLHDHWIFDVFGQVLLGQVHLVFHALEGVVDVFIRIELHRDGRSALHRGGSGFLHIFQALEFLLNGARDQFFYILGRRTNVYGTDDNERDGNIGSCFAWQSPIGIPTEEDEDEDKDVDCDLVPDGVVRNLHGSRTSVTRTRSPLMRSRPPRTTNWSPANSPPVARTRPPLDGPRVSCRICTESPRTTKAAGPVSRSSTASRGMTRALR